MTHPKKILINLSNHPFADWDDSQKEASVVYGPCVDLPFPNVEPSIDENGIEALADDYEQRICELAVDHDVTVHLMGEMTFCYALLERLKAKGIVCIASCSSRNVVEHDGMRTSVFVFKRFRRYGC